MTTATRQTGPAPSAEHSLAGQDSPAGTNPTKWVDAHGDMLFALALRTVRDRNEAEEIVQETLLAALESRESFRGASSERTWLVGILRHKLLDCLRRRGREALEREQRAGADSVAARFTSRGLWRETPGKVASLDTPTAERAELRATLSGCLQRLPRRTAEVFLLCEEHGLAAEKVGETLGTTAQSVWSAMYRARMQLRECLERKGLAPADASSMRSAEKGERP